MRIGNKSKKQNNNNDAWITTYADMVTLLLTFFVLLFTVAKIEGRDFRLILSAFRGSIGILQGGQTIAHGRLEDMGMHIERLPANETGRTLAKALKIATEIFKPEIQAHQVKISNEEKGLVISLVSSDNFEPGSARLTIAIKDTLIKSAELLRNIDNHIRIEGFTDENPVTFGKKTNVYETNWELASQRAINALRFLYESESISPHRMSATSYGKYRPLSISKTPEARALNRRVDIVVLKEKIYLRNYKDTELPVSKIPGVEYLLDE